MLKVGLTGGIGSGKSIVSQIFEVLGIPVYDADRSAKALMETNQELVEALIKEFGSESYQEGKLNREYIASRVFGNEEKLQKLNALVHPVTIRDAALWMADQKGPYVIKEAALIFESGSEKGLDYVIGVSAPESIRLERTMQRDQVSKEAVLARMQNQMREDQKMEKCDFIILNDNEKPLLPQVLELDQKLRAISTGNLTTSK